MRAKSYIYYLRLNSYSCPIRLYFYTAPCSSYLNICCIFYAKEITYCMENSYRWKIKYYFYFYHKILLKKIVLNQYQIAANVM